MVFSCVEKNFSKQEIFEERVSEEFVQGSEDIPLLIGMEKISEDSLGFDSNSGSIMSSSYESKIDLGGIEIFYQKTLPQMGWKQMPSDLAKLKFRREKEKLEIEFVNQNGKDVVRFFLSSAL